MIFLIPITEKYELVDWNDNPTYSQMLSTIFIIELYYEDTSSFNKKYQKQIEKWLETNSLQQFKSEVNKLDEIFEPQYQYKSLNREN